MRAWEGGTVLDVFSAASQQGLAAGSSGRAATVWPADAGPLPTADRPELAMVLVPRSGTEGRSAAGGPDAGADAPTWVFPFDRPLPPAEGDNQALAVNTEDGSVRYDVSFALVWADGDAAVNRNEAYALASCRDCTTVAVAFQVVLLVGSVDVVVPENVAVAVNYACVECVTQALATQLVLTLPGPLEGDAARELDAIWAELQAFAQRIEGMPLAEIRDRLTGFERRIVQVVEDEGEPGDVGKSDEASPTAIPTRTAEPSGSDGGTATTDGSDDEPATGTGTPTATSAPTTASDATPSGSDGAEATPTTAQPSATGDPAAPAGPSG